MLSIGYLFEETLTESIYEDTKETLAKYFNMKVVQDFLDLSKKVIKNGADGLSAKEKDTYRGLFEDPAIKDYIIAARKTGTRDGWIRGIALGGIGGGTAGVVAGGDSIAAAITLGVLGAAAGGAALGWSFSKALNWLRKWKAEDDVVKLGKAGGQIGKTTPIVGVNIK